MGELFPLASGRLWSPVVAFFSPSSVSQVRALLLLSSIDYKIKEGRGRGGPCVRMEREDPAPCGQTLTHSEARATNAGQDLKITHPNNE